MDEREKERRLAHIEETAEKATKGELLSRKEGLALCSDRVDLLSLMGAANRVRERFFGRKVSFCSIINAKSGRCPGDCVFCAQSARHACQVSLYPLMGKGELLDSIQRTARGGASHVGIVTSGMKAPQGEELETLLECVRELAQCGSVKICCSMGQITEGDARRLKEAGVVRYHHNLESSLAFYGNISRTIRYADKLATVRAAKKAGLETCCGGIFGLGESWEDRVELAMTIRELGVDSVPLNFLRPVEGTPLEKATPLSPREALRIVALFRLMLPDKTIKVCGGREYVLRDMQSWMYHAGANGAILGNYLTTTGRPPQEDLQMVADLGLEAV